MEEEYEFDVAFSFTFEDELLASQLNDYVQSTFSTFIYTNKQNQLAARDGEVKFNDIFHNKARLVVILYSDKWGETPFTRIEKNAIRNRAFEKGYDFTIMVPLRNSKPPDWYPKNRLYLNLDKYGVQTLAAVIESKIQELGGESRVESATDVAQRIKRANEIKGEIYKYSHSSEAVNDGVEAFRILTEKFKSSWEEVKKIDIGFGVGTPKINHGTGGGDFKVGANGIMLRFEYRTEISNNLEGSSLTFWLYQPPSIWNDRKTRIFKEVKYAFGLDQLLRKGWLESDSYYSSDQLVEYWTKEILELAKDKN